MTEPRDYIAADAHEATVAELQKENARLGDEYARLKVSLAIGEVDNKRLREALIGVRECPQCGALCELHAELSFEALNPPKGGAVQKGLSKEKAK